MTNVLTELEKMIRKIDAAIKEESVENKSKNEFEEFVNLFESLVEAAVRDMEKEENEFKPHKSKKEDKGHLGVTKEELEELLSIFNDEELKEEPKKEEPKKEETEIGRKLREAAERKLDFSRMARPNKSKPGLSARLGKGQRKVNHKHCCSHKSKECKVTMPLEKMIDALSEILYVDIDFDDAAIELSNKEISIINKDSSAKITYHF
jgi:hypothetical protein